MKSSLQAKKTYREATLACISRVTVFFHLLPGKDAREAECIIVTSISHAIVSFSREEMSPSMGMVTSTPY
jgi:hypothetical protein